MKQACLVRSRQQYFSLYPFQQVIAVLTATLLISSVCGTPLDSGLAAAGIGTLVYLILSGFKIPMFVSNAGGTVSAVISTLALSGGNPFAVMVGGAITALLYLFVGLGIKKSGTNWLTKLLPDYLIGSIILVIGINLSKFSDGSLLSTTKAISFSTPG